MRIREAAFAMVLSACALAGCRSDQGKPTSGITSDEWSIGSGQNLENHPRGDPSAVLFIEFVVTPQDVVNRMLKMANVTSSDVVYDLGCGDGRIVVTAARRYRCRAVGYDLDRLRVEEAKSSVERHRVGRLVTIEQKDVLTADFQEATVVTLYMGTEMNARLIPQLSRLKAGTRIVSHNFALGDIPPDETIEMTSRDDGGKHRLYLWNCPLKVGDR